MRRGYIYGLRDPHTGELRYVGKTVFTPQQRMRGHVLGAARGSSMRVAHWIRTLGVEPYVTVLESNVDEALLDTREERWIGWMLDAGHPLLNTSRRVARA